MLAILDLSPTYLRYVSRRQAHKISLCVSSSLIGFTLAAFVTFYTTAGPYMCPVLVGRLGNQLYQYASVFGISNLTGAKVILGQDDELVKYFDVPSAQIRTNRDVCATFVQINEKYCCVFDESLMQLGMSYNYRLGVYLQSWRYFEHVLQDIRTELSIKKIFKQAAVHVIQTYRETYSLKHLSNVVVVGVHIRRGDIATDKSLQEFGAYPAPDTYVHHAIAYFLERFSPIVFVVCSDDIGYAKAVMNYNNITVESFHGTPIEDLAILSSCDHVITTVGTFGWWGGFLSGGTVVYYKYPMKENSTVRIQYNK